MNSATMNANAAPSTIAFRNANIRYPPPWLSCDEAQMRRCAPARQRHVGKSVYLHEPLDQFPIEFEISPQPDERVAIPADTQPRQDLAAAAGSFSKSHPQFLKRFERVDVEAQ